MRIRMYGHLTTRRDCEPGRTGRAALVDARDGSRSRSSRKRTTFRIVGIVLSAVVVVAACGGPAKTPKSGIISTSAQAAATSFAQTFNIGGRRQLYLTCRGNGPPTVILIPGLVTAADTWSYVGDSSGLKASDSAVLPEVSTFSRVCSYDRPGTVREDGSLTPSTPVRQPTNPERDVADLHALLAAAKVPGPYVLAGWSYGGPIARVYASTYPQEVAGLILVDALNEYEQSELTPAQFSVLVAVFQGDNERRMAQWKDVEQIDALTTYAQLRAAPPVHAMPVVVISSDRFDPNAFRARLPADAPVDFPEVFWRAHLAAQDDLAGLFSGAKHITNTDSEHNVQNESPQQVIEAIRDVVKQARRH